MISRLFNMSLRLGSLGLKLLLTLYMAKYLGLTELGTYGLVAAYVNILIPLLGFRLDYIVSREIVDVPRVQTAAKLRDQAIFYGFNYIFLAAAALMLVLFSDKLDPRIIIFTLLLAITESFSAVTSGNFIPLGRPIVANVLFFIRSALWAVPVMLIGFFYPDFRDAETVFAFWIGGIVISLIVSAFLWRGWPWGEIRAIPVDWAWMKNGVRNCFPIWLGAVAGAAASSIDRFVVEHYLGRDFVGIVSFYGSFTVAIMALLTSGIFAFAYPQMIRLYNQGDLPGFNKMVRKITWEAVGAATAISLLLAYAIPLMGHYLGQPEFYEQSFTLWLLLAGTCIRAASEAYYYVLYTWKHDSAVWIINLMNLALALVLNMALVPVFGFAGIGYSSIATALLTLVWRLYAIRRYRARNP